MADGIVGNIAEFGGNVIKGAASVAETAIGGTRFGQRLKQNDANELSQLLQTYRSIDPSQTEQRNQVLQRITATPTFQKFQGTIGPLAQSQVDKSKATEKISKLARAGSSAEEFISEELRNAIGSKITQSFADIGIVGETSNEVSGSQKIRLSSLFSTGLKDLKKTSKDSLASPEEMQAFANKFKTEATKAGASPTAAAALFGELHDEEAGKRGVFRNDVLPKGSNAAKLFAVEPVNDFGARPDGTEKGTGFLGILTGTNPQGQSFESTEFSTQSDAVKVDGKRIDFPTLVPTLSQTEVDSMMNDVIPNGKNIPEPIMQKAIKHAKKRLAERKNVFADNSESPTASPKTTESKDPLKAFEKFVQVSTPDFPEDNTPKPRAALGITEIADQQTMQELETAAPKGLDIQSVAQQDPEAFKQILAAVRKGKTPSGKPFTITDALKMMGQL